MQVPPLQIFEPGQPFPQEPQFLLSLPVSTQRFPHSFCPGWQTHTPPLHVPLMQATPQPPQCSASDARSTHAPAHAESPPVQVAVQTRSLHTGVLPPQTTPHDPQFSGSEVTFVQLGPQRSCPGGQMQRPAMQTSSPTHAAPQAEQ